MILKEGLFYLTRSGETLSVVKINNGTNYSFQEKDGYRQFLPNGRFISNNCESENDLILEVNQNGENQMFAKFNKKQKLPKSKVFQKKMQKLA